MPDMLLPVLTSMFAFAIAAGAPGPATLAVAGVSMAQGRRAGLAIAMGLSVGLAFWGVLVALGLSYLLAQFAAALFALKLVGAGYLFYLAYKSYRAARDGVSIMATPTPSRGMFRRGLLLNLLNPKAALAWVAALALGSGALISAVMCAVVGLLLYVLYATVFSLAPVMAAYRRAARAIEGVFAAVFALAGLKLLFWRTAP